MHAYKIFEETYPIFTIGRKEIGGAKKRTGAKQFSVKTNLVEQQAVTTSRFINKFLSENLREIYLS
jgi:hypothetical protein